MLPLKNFLLYFFKALLVLIFVNLCFFQLKAQGLQFNSNDSLLTKRTSFTVFTDNAVEFKNNLHIDFDLSVWDKSNLGYILNLVAKNNSYSLSYLYNNGVASLNFNIDSKSNKLKIPLSASLLKRKKWIKVKMDFNLAADEVNININNKNYHADKLGLSKTIKAKLIFGKNPLYTEVPQMAIKNLSVTDDEKQYFFPLNEWKGNDVHDSNDDIIGYVENPFWLIKESYFWKPFYSHSFKDVAGLNFDPLNQKIFILSKDSLITYDAEEKTITSTAYKNKMPVQMVLGKSIFNAKENKCYIYELFDVRKQTPSIAALDMNTLEWQTVGKTTLPTQLHHHNIFYDLQQDTFYLFGGYGSYNYHNAFMYYDKTADKWRPTIFKGDVITPRFFSAIGPSGNSDEIFLFGGYGNESGNQVVGGKQYYDLYRINLKNHTIKKCWEIHPDSSVFVPANNLILSNDKRYFYALCYPHEVAKTELTLYKFSIRDGSYEKMCAPIPVTSERIESDVNLFYNSSANEFFCTEQEFADKNNLTIKIFSLEAPPLSRAQYNQSLNATQNPKSIFVYVVIGAGIMATIVIIILYKRLSPKKQVSESVAPEPVFIQQETFENDNNEIEIIKNDKKENAVYLLGEFLVFDKNGRDITHLFSPKIKQLFVLLLLSTVNSEGISSKKISMILWPDKDVSKTKNIKGVTFNHLRNAISDIKGLELCFTGDNYCFKMSEDFFCDYCIVSKIFKEHIQDFFIPENSHLILRGNLLSEMPEPWLDDFKYEYEKRLINLLNPHLKNAYEKNDLKNALEIARLILNIEPFNDEALKYQLLAFKKLKGNGHAKKIFEHFTEEYKKSIGTEYPFSFEKLLTEKHS